jgi:hypothetical protein
MGAAVYLAWLAVRRSEWKASVVRLEVMRVGLVAAAVALLNQPEWVQEVQPDDKPTIAVLFDQSYSMRTRDESSESVNRANNDPIARSEALAPLKSLTQSKRLSNDYQITLIPFAADEPSGYSNLSEPLEATLKNLKNLHAVVFASDGDWNSGSPPSTIAERLRAKQIPLLAVPVGSKSQLPDLELVSFDVPGFGITGKTVQIPVTVESSLPRATNAVLVMSLGDATIQQKEIAIQAMGQTSLTIPWKPTSAGSFQLKLVLPKHVDEVIADNNIRVASIVVRDERLKVLVVESYPRWEYRYLRNALSRDPGVDVSCLLFQSGLAKVGGGNRDYISEFPETLEELSKFDVVFLGDVGMEAGQLSEENCRLLQGLVQRQAAGLVFMPGWQGRQLSLIDGPLKEMFPIVFDLNQPEGWGSRTPAHFELTELGRRSLLTRLADSIEDNLVVWENLPGFQWYAPILRAKAGTDVLAVHGEAMSAQGRVPLLVTQTYGVGKILFMGTDGAWRWRKGVEDRYHYRFWGQVVRWMAYQRNMAKGETIRLYYSPEQPDVRQTVFLNANVTEKNGEPLTQGEVSVRIVSPSGAAETLKLDRQGEEWGAFQTKFVPQEAGLYTVTMRSSASDDELEAELLVQGQSVERLGKPARPEVLDELAKITRGAIARPSDVEGILVNWKDKHPAALEVQRRQLWSHGGLAVTLIGMMAAFWIGRKWSGQI